MFPVLKAVFSRCDREHKMRSDRGCAPATVQGPSPISLWRAAWVVPAMALVLCLAVHGAAWASEPSEGRPAASFADPRAVQSATWSGFTPTGWVNGLALGCSVTVSSTIGLESGSEVYSVSQNGGVTWSEWSSNGLSGIILDGNTHVIAVTDLVFQDSATLNRIRFRAYETGGVALDSPTYTVKVDTTPPGSPAMLTGSPARQWTRINRFSESWLNPDDLSGIVGAYYKLNSPPTSATDGTYVELHGDVDTISDIQVGASGKHDIYVWLVDAAGNKNLASVASDLQVFWYDGILPSSQAALSPALPASRWYTTSVGISFTATDLPSDPALPPLVYARLNGGTWAVTPELTLVAEGWQELEYQARDKAGNVETEHALGFGIDRTAPAAPAGLQIDPDGWTDTNAFDVTWTAPADLSGVAGAYYKLGDAPTHPRDGVYITGTQRIEDLTATAEGAQRLYLWLRDEAGNADHTTASAEGPFLRFDGTDPVTTISLSGSLGSKGWYRTPVDAALTAADGVSGVSALHYSEDGGEWQQTSTGSAHFTYSEAGTYSLQYYAEDLAGNVEATKTSVVKVDYTAPVPLQVSVLPEKGSTINSFRLEWPPIEDLSGVAGAYVRFGSPPSGPMDGTYYAGATAVDGVVAPGEGRHTAYVWLADDAGNVDHSTAVVLPDAVCYDVHAPTTVVTPTVQSGLDGWYVGPVTFVMSASDAGSGVREIRYQVDEGPWASGELFVIGEDGRHTIRISAVDHAGNVEPEQDFDVAIDRTPPLAAFPSAGSIQPDPGFEVTWSGWDSANGSGLAGFDVEVRNGYDAPWETWLQETSLTAAHYDGERGHTYFFRVFARDRAGNRQTTGSTTGVLVQPVLTGGFDTGVFEPWAWGASGRLPASVGWTDGPDGALTLAAQLGSEDLYGPGFEDPGSIPQDSATISQVIAIPPHSQVQWPALAFWYRVKTYDVLYSQSRQRYGDTFDAKLCAVGTPCTGPYDGAELERLLRDGNPMSSYLWWALYLGAPPLYDTGWKAALIDLKEFAGQTLQLVFANENRIDNKYNTWSYVDDIRIVDLRRTTFAPYVSAPGVRAAAAAIEPSQGPEVLSTGSEEPVR